MTVQEAGRTGQFEILDAIHIQCSIHNPILASVLHGTSRHRMPGGLDGASNPVVDRSIIAGRIDNLFDRRW
jgi:hypothetical protein